MARTRARVDSNQREIVRALRESGCTVAHLHNVGKGVPDLLVGINGSNYLIEVKSNGGKLTSDQITWHGTWAGQVSVVTTPTEALLTVGYKE